jgi:NAD(P)-dependent dehydrogenase (short-subunit alcohol dehydrogenase family)
MNDSRLALVTGAQQGIGAAAALALGRAGYNVLVNYFDDEQAAQAVCAELVALGREARAVHGDMRSEADLVALAQVATQAGGLAVLVNNAAIFPRSGFLEMTLQEWDDVHGINLRAVFRLSQLVARAMVADGQGGSIVNITSGAAFRGSPRGAHYVSAKAGIIGLTRAMSQELAEHGVRVNAVAPGLTDTAQPRYGMSEEEIAAAAKLIPLGRISTAVDIADTVAFLCSSSAQQITGQVLHVNGGQYLG